MLVRNLDQFNKDYALVDILAKKERRDKEKYVLSQDLAKQKILQIPDLPDAKDPLRQVKPFTGELREVKKFIEDQFKIPFSSVDEYDPVTYEHLPKEKVRLSMIKVEQGVKELNKKSEAIGKSINREHKLQAIDKTLKNTLEANKDKKDQRQVSTRKRHNEIMETTMQKKKENVEWQLSANHAKGNQRAFKDALLSSRAQYIKRKNEIKQEGAADRFQAAQVEYETALK